LKWWVIQHKASLSKQSGILDELRYDEHSGTTRIWRNNTGHSNIIYFTLQLLRITIDTINKIFTLIKH
jgi:hypothetical protein